MVRVGFVNEPGIAQDPCRRMGCRGMSEHGPSPEWDDERTLGWGLNDGAVLPNGLVLLLPTIRSGAARLIEQ